MSSSLLLGPSDGTHFGEIRAGEKKETAHTFGRRCFVFFLTCKRVLGEGGQVVSKKEK